MEKIKKVVVQYESGQTDEFTGPGLLQIVNTTVTKESWPDPEAKEPKLTTVPVKYLSITMAQ